MFRFAEPTYLYLLALIPLFAAVRFALLRRQRRKLRRFGDPALLRQLMPDVSRWRPHAKFWLLEVVSALFIAMLARPQMGTKISQEKRTGIETIIAMDISNSMYAKDVAPSRLERSKMMVENLVDNFTDDKIGLIVFAGDAFVQLPITSDYVSAKMFLSDINPSMIATQGTDLAGAINMAAHSFTQQQGIGKAIIVITDGEDHEGGAIDAAKEAKSKGMRVYVLGVGSPQGAPIPIPGTGDYMRDNAGNTVMSALNEKMCKDVAEAGGGAYIHVSNNSKAQEQLSNELDKLAKKETDSTVYSDYDEQFQAFGLIAFLLLIIETCLLDRRSPIFKNVTLFSKRTKRGAVAFALLLVSAATANAQTDRMYVQQGNKLFRSGSYADAEVAYRKALEQNPQNPQALFNLGNAMLAQGKDSAAVEAYGSATRVETNPKRKAQAYHNIGVVCQQSQLYADAIESYKEALRLNPSEENTRYNLELCKWLLKKQQSQQQEQNQQQQQDKNDDQQQEQQEQQKQQQDQQNQQQQEEQERNKMDKETAEQLLNAAVQQEKDTQERMKKAMQQAGKRKLEKNW